LIYNGCVVDGTVERSILFPGVHVKKGAVVRNSVLFFNNAVGENAVLDKVVSDVNTVFGEQVRVGADGPVLERRATVVGWNNHVPAGAVIGSDCTIYPELTPEKFDHQVYNGEIIR
jgi:glucose-1-phosphate adenylyltransferase